jgi:hypothetical protein
LVRIEQLVAACQAHGGRAAGEDDPLLAHLVIPYGEDMVDDEVFYVAVHDGHGSSWDASSYTLLTVTRARSRDRESEVLGTLDPNDDDGFARVLGEWTRSVPPLTGWQRQPITPQT